MFCSVACEHVKQPHELVVELDREIETGTATITSTDADS
jgi:hypothetical protein